MFTRGSALTALWVQAAAGAVVAIMTTWAIFFSDLPEVLLTQLRAEIAEAKQEVRDLKQERKDLIAQINELTEAKQTVQDQAAVATLERDEAESDMVDWLLKKLQIRSKHHLSINRAVARIGANWNDVEEWLQVLKEAIGTEARLPQLPAVLSRLPSKTPQLEYLVDPMEMKLPSPFLDMAQECSYSLMRADYSRPWQRGEVERLCLSDLPAQFYGVLREHGKDAPRNVSEFRDWLVDEAASEPRAATLKHKNSGKNRSSCAIPQIERRDVNTSSLCGRANERTTAKP